LPEERHCFMIKQLLETKSVDGGSLPGQTIYASVANRIAAMIDGGTLRQGERVPSVRKMSRQMGVAIGTVLHAYRILEDRGRIAARPQSGFYVCPTRPPLPEPRTSLPRRRAERPTVGDLVMRMGEAISAPDVVPLGHAVPSPDCLPTKQLNRISAAIARTSSRGFNTYDVPPGCRELRVQVAKHYLDAGCALAPDDLITTSGCQEALCLCLRAAVCPGGVVAVESPAFYGILQAIQMLGMRALELPTDPRDGVELHALERAIRHQNVSACLFVTNCHNPLGFTMPEQKKRQLVRLLSKYEIPLIEDDTYGDLAYGPDRPKVCKAFDEAGLVLLCSSFSKTLAPGARVGWCAPGRYLEEVKVLKFCNTLATATLPQLMIAEYMAGGGYAHQLRRMRRIYSERVQLVAGSVQRHFPDGTRASRPAGGHVLWIELPNGSDSMQMFERAAAMKISIAPGPLFSTSGGYLNCMRLNCSCPCDAKLEQTIRLLGQLACEPPHHRGLSSPTPVQPH
jgi:DNA-binding transcriptional MocR family regulator